MEVDDHGQREHPRYFPPPHRHQFSSVPPSCQTLYDPRDCTDSQSFSIRVFSSQSVLRIRWPKYWDFSCSISPSNEYSGRISFTMNWLDVLAVQGTLKSLLQHHSSKASILPLSAFFVVQLSHPYMTTGKTIALTTQTLSAKKYLCFLICCLGWSYLFFQAASILLISWLQSPSAVILEPKRIKRYASPNPSNLPL